MRLDTVGRSHTLLTDIPGRRQLQPLIRLRRRFGQEHAQTAKDTFVDMKNISPYRIITAVFALIIVGVMATVLVRLPTTTIPAMRQPVPAGTIVSEQMITEISWPLNAVYPGLVRNPAEMVGKRTVTNIAANQPITSTMLTSPQNTADVVDPRLVDFDANKLEIFVPTDLRRSSGGSVKNGDYVNIVRQNDNGGSQVILQKIHVVGVRGGDGSDLAEKKDPKTGKPVAVNVPAGFMIMLTPDQMTEILAIDPSRLFFVKTNPDNPDIPGVESGLEAYNPTGAPSQPSAPPSEPASPGQSLMPSPSGEPSVVGGDEDGAAQSEAPLPDEPATPDDDEAPVETPEPTAPEA